MRSKKIVYIAKVKEIPVGEAKGFMYPVGDQKGN
jgi:hypothetical protein